MLENECLNKSVLTVCILSPFFIWHFITSENIFENALLVYNPLLHDSHCITMFAYFLVSPTRLEAYLR